MMSRRDIGLFAFARGVSNFGGNGAHVALLVVLASESGSYVGVYMGAVAFVSVVFAPLNGYLADKVGPKYILVTSDLLCAGCFITIASSEGSVAWTITFGVLSALFEGPSNIAGIVAIGRQHDDRVTQMLGTVESARNVGNVIGPAASAVVISFLGVVSAFVINALTFLASACAFFLIRGFSVAEVEVSSKRLGFIDIASNIALRRLVLAWIMVVTVASVLVVSDPFRAGEVSSTEDWSSLLGVVLSARALGSLCGSMLIASRGIANSTIITIVGILVMCIALIGMGALDNVIILVVCSFVFGFGDSFAFVGRVTLTSKLVDRSVLGKAQAGFDAIIGIMLTITPPAGALLVDKFGATIAQLTSSGVLLLAALIIIFGVLRQVDQRELIEEGRNSCRH